MSIQILLICLRNCNEKRKYRNGQRPAADSDGFMNIPDGIDDE